MRWRRAHRAVRRVVGASRHSGICAAPVSVFRLQSSGGVRGGTLTFGSDGRDPYLRLPLRLQARTRHGVLYAYNAVHLDWIEAFVAAPLRERRIATGRANRSIASRLPAWVKAAKNREDVLRALARMRRGLAAVA
jgi:hypothetical protein